MQRLSIVLAVLLLCACVHPPSTPHREEEITAGQVHFRILKEYNPKNVRFWRCGTMVRINSITFQGHAWADYYDNNTGEPLCEDMSNTCRSGDRPSRTWRCE